jgi:hypothetical protein
LAPSPGFAALLDYFAAELSTLQTNDAHQFRQHDGYKITNSATNITNMPEMIFTARLRYS